MDYKFKIEPIGSYNEFLADTSLLFDKHLRGTKTSEQFRYGQFFYSRLMSERSDIAEAILNTNVDPYFQHAVNSEQHQIIEKLWQNGIRRIVDI